MSIQFPLTEIWGRGGELSSRPWQPEGRGEDYLRATPGRGDQAGPVVLAAACDLQTRSVRAGSIQQGKRKGGVEGEGANAGGRREMPGEGRAAVRYLQAPSICLEDGARSPGRGSRGLGLDYDAKQCRGVVLDFGERTLSIATGPVNIRAEYLAPMSSTAKQLQLRYSGWECPNIQCQASIQTSKHGLNKDTTNNVGDAS
jgi:hypothetical protein